jgi:hypothetical protein
MTMAAAAMLVTSGLASAQTMKAEIPFAFIAGGARMQAGTYEVHVASSSGNHKFIQVSNVENRHSILAVPDSASWSNTSGAANVVISFACTEGKCELAGMRGMGGAVYTFAHSRNDRATRIAEVVLRPDRAD